MSAGLAGEIDARGFGRRLALPFAADPREGIAFDQERRVVDGGRPVADDQPRTFEPELGLRLRREQRRHDGACDEDWQEDSSRSHTAGE